MTFEMQPEIKLDTSYYKVLDIRYLTESTFVLQMPASRFKFEAGQHVSLSVLGDFQSREYSIYSAEDAEFLEVLVKEVDGGYFTPKLKNLKKGDILEIHGPFGRFSLDKNKLETHRHIFIASGTGIAPFRSMIMSNLGLDYQIIHGVRHGNEAYERELYAPERYLLCTSRDESGDYKGRLTGYLKETEFDKNSSFYLCGNSDMIFDAMEILKGKGFGRKDINVEVYF
ncbi:MAG: oxidoreductase [Bacteroidales bacterium]|jgi:ferredoxin-NADP reductase|nr:FAD-binding oxidoreductase [Mariniphaga sp.]NLB92182.1 oxidoreductase [Bacteroidales bacterium]